MFYLLIDYNLLTTHFLTKKSTAHTLELLMDCLTMSLTLNKMYGRLLSLPAR